METIRLFEIEHQLFEPKEYVKILVDGGKMTDSQIQIDRLKINSENDEEVFDDNTSDSYCNATIPSDLNVNEMCVYVDALDERTKEIIIRIK